MKSAITSFFFITMCLCVQQLAAQYTETINTNNPGRSQGAFAVGTGVAQIEGSLYLRNEEHGLQSFQKDYTGIAFQIRYGAFFENLEFSYFGNFASVNLEEQRGFGNIKDSFANLSRSTLGAKYLVFDPLKFFGERTINVKSWKANKRLNWRDLIPAVSVYAGANIDLSPTNSLTPPNDPTLSPRFELITQNNLGRWVFVTNFIVDRITTDYPSYSWITTLTHSINGKWALFGEYQGFKSDFYSDDLVRGGITYLITKNWQVDTSATTNFKDTPSVFQVNLGMSYRLDFHKDKEIKESKKTRGSKPNKRSKKDKKKKKIDL